MPQKPDVQANHAQHSSLPVQIAQGGPEAQQPSTDVHTETSAAGGHEEPPPGEIPAATTLFGNAVLVALILIAFALAARSRLMKVPKGFANFAEFVAEALNNFTVGIIGPGGEKYTPLVGTIFLFIFLSNLIGLIPGLHSPTANLTTTFALGLTVFIYVQYQGIRQQGLGGYLRHFMGPSLTGKFPELFWLLGPIELISEFIKPFTLAIRLFGNIFGEDVIIIVLAGLGATFASYLGWLPIHFPIMLLALLTDFVQAMVFSILTCIYISLMSHHDHSEHGEEGAVESSHAHATGH